jgi:hypothetical protein
MPAEFWAGMVGDRQACEEALRLVVSMTKRHIRESLGLNVSGAELSADFTPEFSVALSDALARIGFRAS